MEDNRRALVRTGGGRHYPDMDASVPLQLFSDASCQLGSVKYPGNFLFPSMNNANLKMDEIGDIKQTGNFLFPSMNNVNWKMDNAGDMSYNLQISLNNFVEDKHANLARVSNPADVSTGLRLSYEDDERNSSVTSASGSMSTFAEMMSLSEGIRNELNKQALEIEHYIRCQEEQMAKGLKEINQRHMLALLGAMERGVVKKLREKELEVECMNRRNKELAEQIRQAAVDVQSWQSAALYNEALVNSLKGKLEQAIACQGDHPKEGWGDNEELENVASSKPNEALGGFFQSSLVISRPRISDNLVCRSCRSREASVLLMPCRHLCLCQDCDGSIEICPVCQTKKSARVPVNLS